ncbi:glycoside hydrolase family protein, partial [Draconibacterium sp.]|nr:glycoside hydrolase family protein [Draconibacterium sp.]
MKVIRLFMLLCLIHLFSCSPEHKTEPGKLNLARMFQPVPKSAKFINDSCFIWGGSLVKSEVDGKFHMYYSRWPKELGMSAWVTHSEIAHAVADSPFGPFEFKGIALSLRGREFWDGAVTHNPTIHFFDGKYYLYYMGTTGDSEAENQYWEHRNKQQIGVAVAENPYGPWKRFDKPLIGISADSTAHDALMVSNPSVTKTPDGKYLMVYKAAAKKLPMPMSGPVVHLTAIAEKPEGPFVKQMKPIFTAKDAEFPAEDPYIWSADDCYYAIVKDMRGAFTDSGRSLVLFYSIDGMD